MEAWFRRRLIKWYGVYNFVSINYAIFSVIGVVSFNEKFIRNRCYRTSLRLMKTIFIFFAIFVAYSLLNDAYSVRNDLDKLSFNLSSTIFFVGNLTVGLVLCTKISTNELYLEQLENNLHLDWVGETERDIEILQRGENILKNACKKYYVIGLAFILPFRAISQLRATDKLLLIPIPHLGYVESPYFEIIFLIQYLLMSYFVILIIHLQLLIYSFLMRVYNHFEILTENISDIRDLESSRDMEKGTSRVLIGKENAGIVYRYSFSAGVLERRNVDWSFEKYWNEQITEYLRKLIIHHQNILLAATKVQWTYNESYLIILTKGILLVTVTLVDAIVDSKLSFLTISQLSYCLVVLLGLAVICYAGTRIEEMSHEAAIRLYECPWLDMNIRNRKTILLLLKGLWHHPKIRAGNFILNLEMCVSFGQFIYNLMNFMLNFIG